MDVSSNETPGIVQRCFSLDTPEATLNFQIIDLGKQYYVWLSSGSTNLSNLYLAIKGPADSQPSVATIIPGSAASVSHSLSQRLAIKAGKPVLCSCNLPANSPMLQAIAERRLLQELTAMAAGGSA